LFAEIPGIVPARNERSNLEVLAGLSIFEDHDGTWFSSEHIAIIHSFFHDPLWMI
jgi:hypothetical protein